MKLEVMELYHQLALFTDAEAKRCLEGVLTVFAAESPELRKFYGTEQAVAESVAEAAQLAKIGDKVPRLSEHAVKDESAAIRVILVQIASRRGDDLAKWLQGKRDTLFEPIATALVLAGIVFVLQLDIAVEIKDGKVSGHVKKSPTDSKLLEKFFSLFR
jgi:hypothetical protein